MASAPAHRSRPVAGGKLTAARRVRALAQVVGAWSVGITLFASGVLRCPMAWYLRLPCPGCGMTRAVRLLAAGCFLSSFGVHPLAIPALVAGALLAMSMGAFAFRDGSVVRFHEGRAGRLALGVAAGMLLVCQVVWLCRWFGAFGGPVAID